jgi:hypothetical protein
MGGTIPKYTQITQVFETRESLKVRVCLGMSVVTPTNTFTTASFLLLPFLLPSPLTTVCPYRARLYVVGTLARRQFRAMRRRRASLRVSLKAGVAHAWWGLYTLNSPDT